MFNINESNSFEKNYAENICAAATQRHVNYNLQIP